MHKDITEGKGRQEYLSLIDEIGTVMTFSSSCSLGERAPEAALSAISYFSEEYEEHIKKKKCDAGVCQSFTNIYIEPSSCEGCTDCMDICPINCIEGKMGYIHMIDVIDCTKCGKCIAVCEAGAIKKTTGKLPKLPDRLTKCGRFKR